MWWQRIWRFVLNFIFFGTNKTRTQARTFTLAVCTRMREYSCVRVWVCVRDSCNRITVYVNKRNRTRMTGALLSCTYCCFSIVITIIIFVYFRRVSVDVSCMTANCGCVCACLRVCVCVWYQHKIWINENLFSSVRCDMHTRTHVYRTRDTAHTHSRARSNVIDEYSESRTMNMKTGESHIINSVKPTYLFVYNERLFIENIDRLALHMV